MWSHIRFILTSQSSLSSCVFDVLATLRKILDGTATGVHVLERKRYVCYNQTGASAKSASGYVVPCNIVVATVCSDL